MHQISYILAGIAFADLILAGFVAFPGCNVRTANETACRYQIAAFCTAIENYRRDTGQYPLGTNALLSLVQRPDNCQHWRGPYLQDLIPKDPWAADYVYACPGRHNPRSYDVCSSGPPGENAVVGNWEAKR